MVGESNVQADTRVASSDSTSGTCSRSGALIHK